MKCANGTCGTEIPAAQLICPACYTIIGDFPAKEPRNVMFFLSASVVNGLYSSWTQKHLQPARVGGNWLADTETAFGEITRDPRAKWHLLVTDVDRTTRASSMLGTFRVTHPNCTTALILGGDGSGPSSANGIVLKSPGDIDSWLLMMHSLLRLT